jgi:hypothetical protein
MGKEVTWLSRPTDRWRGCGKAWRAKGSRRESNARALRDIFVM